MTSGGECGCLIKGRQYWLGIRNKFMILQHCELRSPRGWRSSLSGVLKSFFSLFFFVDRGFLASTMLRQTVRSFGALSLTDNSVPAAQLSRSFSSRSKLDDNTDEDGVGIVRKWLIDLKSKPIPENAPEFTHSRSSGSGGQQVDK